MSTVVTPEFEKWAYEQDWIMCRESAWFAWVVWQASRAALVVELPPTLSHCNKLSNGKTNPLATSYDEAIEDCREALTKAVVTVK